MLKTTAAPATIESPKSSLSKPIRGEGSLEATNSSLKVIEQKPPTQTTLISSPPIGTKKEITYSNPGTPSSERKVPTARLPAPRLMKEVSEVDQIEFKEVSTLR